MENISTVYHTGGLGDFITAFPAIIEWNKRNKSCRKILLGKPSYGILGVHAGLFDEIWDVESAAFSWLYNLNSPAHPSIKDMLSGIQSALLFTSGDSPVLARFRQLEVKKLLFQDPFPQMRIHIADYHLSLFNKDSKPPLKSTAKLFPHPDFKNEADKKLNGIGRFITLHPGSGSERKNWPADEFFALADKLREKGFRMVWIAGPAETEMSFPSTDAVVQNAALPLLVHILSNGSLYIGNDSGISHLAAACGGRCVVLFGPSDAGVWRPVGENIVIVKARNGDCFPCHPSRDKITPKVCKRSCMSDISVEEVFDSCKKVLAPLQ
ncbi:MAG TPA: glycosyltransferase family 9 protein [Chitinivibrionales bacterium]|nr:glycosyltransferase family 9 protein [Chitinivibrionales bacterium]